MEDNKKPTFNVLFARGVVEQDYIEFLKKIFPDYNVVGIIRELNKSLPNVINLILFRNIFTCNKSININIFKV